MTAYPTPTPPLKVKITTGPHGRKTVLEIDGEPVTHANSFTLHSDTTSATSLTVEYTNLDVEVEALVPTDGFNAEHKTYKRVVLAAVDEPEPAPGID